MAKRTAKAASKMDAGQRKIAAGIIAVIVAALAYIAFALTGMFSFRLLFPRTAEPAPPVAPQAKAVNMREVHALALAAARLWRDDAALSSLAAAGSRSERWELVFVSASTKGLGYRVVVDDNRVFSQEEISYRGVGAEFPADDLITPEEAVRQARAIAGYEEATVEGVEAVYGAGGKIWYWGVRTDRGLVSIKARRP